MYIVLTFKRNIKYSRCFHNAVGIIETKSMKKDVLAVSCLHCVDSPC